ncbi:hypothetical protein ACFC09_11565 [Streptomyces sp. NPDC056161]|uniref:hypothetical protein n=1 Tax=Streptomyces sp. NPDC056161 TaxID=3345732 RepID=UPI0035DF4C5D
MEIEGMRTHMPSDDDRPRTRRERWNQKRRDLRAKDPEHREREQEEARARYAENPGYREQQKARVKQRRETDPGYRERQRAGVRNRREDRDNREREQQRQRESRATPHYRKQENERRAEERTRRLDVAKRVYEDYRRWFTWPEVPPRGLKVAVSLGQGRKPVVVRLKEPQPESGPSGVSVPSFIAELALDLTNREVRDKVLREGVSEEACKAAEKVQDDLKSLLSLEEFGEHAVPRSPHADAVMQSGLDGSFYGVGAGVAFAAPDSWSGPVSGPVNAVAPYAGGYGGYVYPEEGWQAPPPGVDALSQGMQGMTIAAPASAQPGYQVAYSSWNSPYGPSAGAPGQPGATSLGPGRRR